MLSDMTRGPWIVHTLDRREGEYRIIGGDGAGLIGEGVIVADIAGSLGRTDDFCVQSAANARAIGQVPNLVNLVDILADRLAMRVDPEGTGEMDPADESALAFASQVLRQISGE